MRPSISIIVPAYNEERLLGQTLKAIRRSIAVLERRGWPAEIVVCDNNSTDRTAEIARQAGATVVFEANNQIARARNTGARVARGEWLLFVDADSEPSPELFEDVVHCIETGTCLAGGSTLHMEAKCATARRVIAVWNWVSRTFRYMAGSFIFCQASAFREVGGFNEALFASEELDLTKRLKRLARRRKMRVVILTEHPLLTSSRKLQLYTQGEYLRFFIRAVLTMGRSIRAREGCHIWYDGRR